MCMHLTSKTFAQVEAKLEQEAEEPHVPLDLAFKQGETIKVKSAYICVDHICHKVCSYADADADAPQVNINIPSKKRTKSPGRANACGAGLFTIITITIIIVLISSY